MYKTLHKKQGSVTVQLRFARSSVTFCAKRDNYAFTFEADKKPEGLSEVKDGDKVTVTYTGTVNEVDAFDGTILSVTKAK